MVNYLLICLVPLLFTASAQSNTTSNLAQSNTALIGQNNVKSNQHHIVKRHIDLKNISTLSNQETLQNEHDKRERRMLIRKKRKRYRRLRKEMREIETFLEANGFKKVNVTKAGKSDKCRENCDWRKRFSVKWKRLDKRVKRLEAWRRNANQKKSIKEYDVFGRTGIKRNHNSNLTAVGHKLKEPEGPRMSGAKALRLEFSTEQTERDLQFKQLVSSRNQSLNGESGRPCSAHQDCQPGLCCHRPANNSTAGTCVDHNFGENQPCNDSCQCRAQLHCIVSKETLDKAPSTISKKGRCRKLSEKNFFNSTNLDFKTLVFVDGQSS